MSFANKYSDEGCRWNWSMPLPMCYPVQIVWNITSCYSLFKPLSQISGFAQRYVCVSVYVFAEWKFIISLLWLRRSTILFGVRACHSHINWYLSPSTHESTLNKSCCIWNRCGDTFIMTSKRAGYAIYFINIKDVKESKAKIACDPRRDAPPTENR